MPGIWTQQKQLTYLTTTAVAAALIIAFLFLLNWAAPDLLTDLEFAATKQEHPTAVVNRQADSRAEIDRHGFHHHDCESHLVDTSSNQRLLATNAADDSQGDCVIRGKVLLEHGPPCRDARVRLYQGSPKSYVKVGTCNTNQRGEFEFRTAASGHLVLGVESLQNGELVTKSVQVDRGTERLIDLGTITLLSSYGECFEFQIHGETLRRDSVALYLIPYDRQALPNSVYFNEYGNARISGLPSGSAYRFQVRGTKDQLIQGRILRAEDRPVIEPCLDENGRISNGNEIVVFATPKLTRVDLEFEAPKSNLIDLQLGIDTAALPENHNRVFMLQVYDQSTLPWQLQQSLQVKDRDQLAIRRGRYRLRLLELRGQDGREGVSGTAVFSSCRIDTELREDTFLDFRPKPRKILQARLLWRGQPLVQAQVGAAIDPITGQDDGFLGICMSNEKGEFRLPLNAEKSWRVRVEHRDLKVDKTLTILAKECGQQDHPHRDELVLIAGDLELDD